MTCMSDALALLEAEELTPFDLLSWTTLLNLLSCTEDPLAGIDINVQASVRAEIITAAKHKAKALDAQPGADGFHAKMLARFGVIV
jgi:hypothetical protein